MSFKIRYYCGESEVEDAESADTLEEAHRIIELKRGDVKCRAEVAVILQVSPSGTEELQESRKLH